MPDKKQLDDIVKQAIKAGQKDWEKVMAAVLFSIASDFGEQTAEDLGVKPKSADISQEIKSPFDTFLKVVKKWVIIHGAESVVTINKTRIDDLKRVIAAGLDENLSNPQIAKNIKQFYADRNAFYAQRIARTETSAAAGFGQRTMAKESGVVKKKSWLSSRDDRVRDSHLAMDGESKDLDDKYSNGLMYPGDPGGDPAESIQCRCVETYITK